MDEISSILLQQIREVEERDEQQVLAEMAGETVAEYIYEVERWNPKTKRMVRNVRLSWVGVREVARSRGNMLLAEPTVTDLSNGDIRFMVKATDLKRNFTVFGGCHQPKMMKVGDYDKKTGEKLGEHLEEDQFQFTKGLSKCQRNALSLCIPGEFAAKFIDKFLQLSGKTPIAAPRGSQAIAQRAKPPQDMPGKSDIKPREIWDKVTQTEVLNYPHLETLIWNLCKLQPAQLYKQLGVSSRNDMNIPAWEAFLSLKEIMCPSAPKSDSENKPKEVTTPQP